METTNKELNILSVDAWHDGQGWSWNAWYKVGTIDKATFEALGTNRKLIRWMRDEGYLAHNSQGLVRIEDDQYNICFQERNGRTVFAIEYGPAY